MRSSGDRPSDMRAVLVAERSRDEKVSRSGGGALVGVGVGVDLTVRNIGVRTGVGVGVGVAMGVGVGVGIGVAVEVRVGVGVEVGVGVGVVVVVRRSRAAIKTASRSGRAGPPVLRAMVSPVPSRASDAKMASVAASSHGGEVCIEKRGERDARCWL